VKIICRSSVPNSSNQYSLKRKSTSPDRQSSITYTTPFHQSASFLFFFSCHFFKRWYEPDIIGCRLINWRALAVEVELGGGGGGGVGESEGKGEFEGEGDGDGEGVENI